MKDKGLTCGEEQKYTQAHRTQTKTGIHMLFYIRIGICCITSQQHWIMTSYSIVKKAPVFPFNIYAWPHGFCKVFPLLWVSTSPPSPPCLDSLFHPRVTATTILFCTLLLLSALYECACVCLFPSMPSSHLDPVHPPSAYSKFITLRYINHSSLHCFVLPLWWFRGL